MLPSESKRPGKAKEGERWSKNVQAPKDEERRLCSGSGNSPAAGAKTCSEKPPAAECHLLCLL